MKKLLSFFFGTRLRTVVFSVTLLLILAILFCATVLPFLQHGPVVLSNKGLNIRQGVFNYLYTFYRYKLPASFQDIDDTDTFWRLIREEDGLTNDEYYGKIALELVYQTVALARIYDRNTTIGAEERAELKEAIDEVVSISYKGGGTKKSFNQNAEKFGFAYPDFVEGTTLLYKATQVQPTLFGQNGGKLSEADLQSFLAEKYCHVMIIFVRTENKFVINDQGNYIPDGNGGYETEPLPPEEREQQLAKVEAVKAAVSDGTTVEEFTQLLLKNNDDADAHKRLGSYYFAEGNDYTTAYAEVFPTVKETALSLAIGQVGVATSSVGTHIIYRTEVGNAPYNNRLYEQFFEDFRQDAIQYLYSKMLTESLQSIKVRDQAYLDGLSFGNTHPNQALIIAYFHGYTVSLYSKN